MPGIKRPQAKPSNPATRITARAAGKIGFLKIFLSDGFLIFIYITAKSHVKRSTNKHVPLILYFS